MNRRGTIVVALFVGFYLGSVFQSLGTARSNQAHADPATTSPEMRAIKSELQAIKDRLPDQAHAMQDVGGQFANLWFAEQQRNWDLAQFFWGETRSHLRWAVRIIPKRKDKAGRDVDLAAILQAAENGPLKQLEESIKAQDNDRFVAAYRFTLETCYACHKASEKPYLRPQIPTRPAVQILNFDPQAKWPM